jgi:hypothetical protein
MRMTRLPPAQAEAHLRHLTQQFARWRQHRPTPRGYRIPDPLWAAAVRLAQILPLTRVAKQLGLKPAVRILPVSAVDFDFDALFSARTWW